MALCSSLKCWSLSSHGNIEIPALNLPAQKHLCSEVTWPYYSLRIESSKRFTVQHTRFLKKKKKTPHLNSSRSPSLPCMIYTLTFLSLLTYKKFPLILPLTSLARKTFNKTTLTLFSCLTWCPDWVNWTWIIRLLMFLFLFVLFHRPAVHYNPGPS